MGQGDEYNEDLTQLRFLKSKPVCFIITGKPGCGKTTLAKKLSQIWRCELLHATDMINREIELESEVGKKISEVLLRGEALSSNFVLQLIREKVLSPEVAHYGYVLDGIPIPDDDLLSVEKQLEIIKNWKLNPDFIINIKIPDTDLENRRTGFCVDSLTGDIYTRQQWQTSAPKKAKPVEQEEGIEEEEEEGDEIGVVEEGPIDFMEVDSATKERLVHAPENMLEFVQKSFQDFRGNSVVAIENFIADHDKQRVIELDGNLLPSVILQQLLNKLECFSLPRGMVPQRLLSQEEEELPEEIETEELLRTVAAYQQTAPRHRWRRSKWGRICPVALADGQLLQGKADLAVSFLDKIYVISSPEAMAKFLKNPRPYLLPPLPSPPCKVAVLGFPLAGKTTLCHHLASHYQAEVIDVKDLMKDRMKAANEAVIEKARQDALESAITLVQNKLEQEEMEKAEARKQEAMEQRAAEAEAGNTDGGSAESAETESNITSVDLQMHEPVPTVTAENEEVQNIVAEAVEKAKQQTVTLPPSDYIEELKGAIEEISRKRLENDPNAKSNGGWILDNFPENKDQWMAMVDENVVPDQVICMIDGHQNIETIRKRYYDQHASEITTEFRARLIAEKKQAIDQETAQLNAITAQSPDKPASPDGSSTALSETESNVKEGSTVSSKLAQLQHELVLLETTNVGVPPHDAPEFGQFRAHISDMQREWAGVQGAVAGSPATQTVTMDITGKSVDDLAQSAVKDIEGVFGYNAWDFSGIDVDEEEEDNNVEGDLDEEEGEGEEDEEASKNKKRQFGYAKHYDIVHLKEDFILCPGNPDIAAKYRERVYSFTSTDNREKFVANPLKYLPDAQPLTPPPPRLLMLGARGAGKTLHGRWLASKLGIFHVSFRERLQEMILSKTGRKLGSEHEEQKMLNVELSVTIEQAVEAAIHPPEEDAPAAGEEEEKFDLNEMEEAIRANLVDDDPLPPEVLDKILPKLWREEQYRSRGFILEGFPRTPEEVTYLQQSGLYPDLAVALMVEDQDVVTRLLPARMDTWKARRSYQNEKKEKIKEAKAKIRKEEIEKRRKELTEEKEQRKAEKAAEEEEGEDDEDEDEEDIEEILANEFQEEEEEEGEGEETEEDAQDRIKAEFGENFDEDVNKLQAVMEQLEEVSIPKIEIQATRKPSIVRFFIDNKLKPTLSHRASIFERAYPVSEAVAAKMIGSGYKHASSFGHWDPVALTDGEQVTQPLRDATRHTFPVVYNQFVYYLSTLANRNAFVLDPLKYAHNKPPALPVVPIQIAVVGPPKCGKTYYAQRFASNYGVVHVSIGKAIRRVLTEMPDSTLAHNMKQHLHAGRVIPDNLAVEALASMLLDTQCTTRGYVLDGCPTNLQQAQMLRSLGVVPVKVIELQMEGKESICRASRDREASALTQQFTLHDSGKIIAVRYKAYSDQITQMREWYTQEHNNVIPTDANMSKWKLWKMIRGQALASVKQIQEYLNHTENGKAAKLANLCINPQELEARLGVYGHYCPVSLNDNGELVDCAEQTMDCATEFRAKYYKTASPQHLEKFLASPEKYVPPLAQRELPPPTLLPIRRKKDTLKQTFPKKFELGGYCSVSYLDGDLRYEALAEGSPEFTVEYDGKLFIFTDEAKLQKFMRKPEKYAHLQLPHKLPPKPVPINVSKLPSLLGYLEQGAADSIIKALTAVGCLKPKFPFLSVKRSALLYVACHLKAYNPKSSDYLRKKFLKKLKEKEEESKLISYLGSNMTTKFRDPSRRPFDFDRKMNAFLSLKAT